MPMSQIRPPALVTEYLASGSLRAAITRRADFLSRDSVRIKLALDTARVSEDKKLVSVCGCWSVLGFSVARAALSQYVVHVSGFMSVQIR